MIANWNLSKNRIIILSLTTFFMLFTGQAFSNKLDVEQIVKCGDSIEGEFTQVREGHMYKISLNPGDKLKIKVVPVGDYLGISTDLFEPLGQIIERGYSVPPGKIVLTSGTLSGRGIYSVKIRNYSRGNFPGRAGIYVVTFQCEIKGN